MKNTKERGDGVTREEAIKILKSGSTFAYDEKEAGEFCEAYDMAINDAVSRQAVMWMLTNLSYTQCKTQGEADVIDTAKTMVNVMPSVQSVQPEQMPESYIKVVWTWLLDYQIKAAELKGKYTPYEVLSWVANDWRKEHE